MFTLGDSVLSLQGHPEVWTFPDGFMMKLQGGEVFKGVASCQVAGLDQTHEAVAYFGTLLGLKEQSVLPMENRALQSLLTQVVVKGSSWTRRNRVRGSQWFCMYRMALPREEFGSTFF